MRTMMHLLFGALAVMLAALSVLADGAPAFVVRKTGAAMTPQTDPIAVVSRQYDENARFEIGLQTGVPAGNASLLVAWGETDGGDDIDAYDGQQTLLEGLETQMCYTVTVPPELKYVRFFVIDAEGFRSDGNAYVDTGIVLDSNSRMTVVFRPEDLVQGQGLAGSRDGARANNFALSQGSSSIVLDFNNSGSGTPVPGRLEVKTGLDARHVYRAEISAAVRRLTDLTAGGEVIGENTDGASTTKTPFTTPASCCLFKVSGSPAVTWGAPLATVKSFVLETNGFEAVRYEPACQEDGVVRLVDRVSGRVVTATGGELVYDRNVASTETCYVYAPTFSVRKMSGAAAPQACPLAVIGSSCDKTGRCREIRIRTGDVISGTPLFVAWGRTDGGDDIDAYDGHQVLVGESELQTCYCVTIPDGLEFVRFFVYDDEGFRSDGSGYVDTGIRLDQKSKITVVFRPEDYLPSANLGIAGARKEARVKSFSLNYGLDGSITLDYDDSKVKPGLPGRLMVSADDISKSHWYKAEVSAAARTLTDLDDNVVVSNNTDATAASYEFTTDSSCLLFMVGGQTTAFQPFQGTVKSFVLETNGVEAVRYESVRQEDGVVRLLDRVSGRRVKATDGEVVLAGRFGSTETCWVAPDEFGDGRAIASVEKVIGDGSVAAHRLTFGAGDGHDYLLYQCYGSSPLGLCYWAWRGQRPLGVVTDATNEWTCAIPPNGGKDWTQIRYYLVRIVNLSEFEVSGESELPADLPGFLSVRGGGGYVDTGFALASGDEMSLDVKHPVFGSRTQGMAGSQASVKDANISAYLSSGTTAKEPRLNLAYANGNPELYCLSTNRASLIWNRLDLSAERRTIRKYGSGAAWTNDVRFADEPFETPGSCLLFTIGGMESGWDRFSGNIGRFSVTRNGRKLADYVPAKGPNGGCFVDLVTMRRVDAAEGSLVCEGTPIIGASRTITGRTSGFMLMIK